MSEVIEAVSPLTATLPRPALARMTRLVRTLFHLGRLPAYRELVLPELPEAARFDPGHDSVMMGYDFHLTAEGPKLIEVNTNAGGALLALLAQAPADSLDGVEIPRRLKEKLLLSFAEEMGGHGCREATRPRHIAILDENPREQFLYPEMLAFARLFEEWGARASIVEPSELEAGPGGVFHEGDRVDLIYNRHCDFYLEAPEMAGIRTAYLERSVCLTPNPFCYGLLADKRRMALWSDPEALASLGLDGEAIELLRSCIPQSRLLAGMDRDALWSSRKELVFKPVSRFGSRGVLLGKKITRGRFEELSPDETLVQQLAPPSVTEGVGDISAMKTDFRLYTYKERILGVAARLYQGQVTNMRTPGGGFAPVKLTR